MSILTPNPGTLKASDGITIRQAKRVTWEPKEDITAYELARAVAVLLTISHGGWNYAEDFVTAEPENVQRHFRIED